MHDYVIVGAGSAGCVLATRLSEDPATSVLLLEAGPRRRTLEVRIPAAFSKLFQSEVDWALRTAPQEHLDGREVYFPLGKTLGGSSAINAMMVLRGHRADQDAWPAGWGWDVVEPYYDAAEGRFPRAAARDRSPLTVAFVESAVAEGLRRRDDLNEPDNEGVGLVPVSQRRGRRFSVADGYLRPAWRRPNLTVVTDVRATRVVVEDGRATGVEYRLGDVDGLALASREVIVSAGAIGSPRLLLGSGIGSADELRAVGIPVTHDLPGVGKNLRDHLANGVVAATAPSVRTLTSAESVPNILRWLVAGRGPLTSNVAEGAAFVRTRSDLHAPDLELIFAPVPFQDEGLVQPTQDGVTVAAILLQPRSVGEVRLRSDDPFDPPIVDPRYLGDEVGHDAEVLLAGIRLARRILAREPLAGQIASEILPGAEAQDDDALLAHIRATSQTLYHPVGTCRMGEDGLAVVDSQLRVRGLAGLRVVDASVMPMLPRGHTNWPTVMVAERAAALIRGSV